MRKRLIIILREPYKSVQKTIHRRCDIYFLTYLECGQPYCTGIYYQNITQTFDKR